MQKLLLFGAILLCTCSCSTYKMANSMWYNITPSELQGVQADVVNGLYFAENGEVFMKTAVVKDTTIIAKPILTGYGKYFYSGSLNKGIQININTELKLDAKATDYKGIVTKEGMVLCAPDSTIFVYQRALKNK